MLIKDLTFCYAKVITFPFIAPKNYWKKVVDIGIQYRVNLLLQAAICGDIMNFFLKLKYYRKTRTIRLNS